MISVFSANATYWICTVTRNLNMREEPTTVGNTPICNIPAGDYVVIDDEDSENGFVYAVWVSENIYGYISEKYIEYIQELDTQNGDVFERSGYSSDLDPQLEIENQTNKEITVSLNGYQYYFDPHETKTITVEEGNVSIFASSPGVIPFSATEYVYANSIYEWHFYITYEPQSSSHKKSTRKKRR